jgi:hypothetical protein
VAVFHNDPAFPIDHNKKMAPGVLQKPDSGGKVVFLRVNIFHNRIKTAGKLNYCFIPIAYEYKLF